MNGSRINKRSRQERAIEVFLRRLAFLASNPNGYVEIRGAKNEDVQVSAEDVARKIRITEQDMLNTKLKLQGA